jgi:small subunit ribosomal protein S1
VNTESNNGSFATELEKYLLNLDTLKPRNIVKGKVVDFNRDYVTVDINFKSYGIIPRIEFEDRNGTLIVKAGDVVEVYIVAIEGEDSQILLSREKAVQSRIWDQVE